MPDWTKLPDLAAVTLLTCAFASVARRGQTSYSKIWLTGWILIGLHFAAFMFLGAPGVAGVVAADVGLTALTAAGVLFMYASIPYRSEGSTRWMLISILAANTLYICVVMASPVADWALTPAAALFAVLPLTVAVSSRHKLQHPMRSIVVSLNCALSIFLLVIQHRPGNGEDLALNGVLFSVFFGCCVHFWYAYQRTTSGSLITIVGFLAWAAVFAVGPWLQAFHPSVHVENEVWNLPKYVVAVGMILLVLEDQIEHNKYLALHDDLTGLPNRRLFQDRLSLSLERARRTGMKTALLVVDLDRFKQVNDTLGHHAGDLLLQRIGEIFTGRIRNSDTVARTGGDEFSVILEDAGNLASASLVAKELLHNLNQPLEIEGRMVRVGASIGVALYPDDAPDMESLCIAADLRMYTEKNLGKGFVGMAPPGRIPPHPAIDQFPEADFRVAAERSRG